MEGLRRFKKVSVNVRFLKQITELNQKSDVKINKTIIDKNIILFYESYPFQTFL